MKKYEHVLTATGLSAFGLALLGSASAQRGDFMGRHMGYGFYLGGFLNLLLWLLLLTLLVLGVVYLVQQLRARGTFDDMRSTPAPPPPGQPPVSGPGNDPALQLLRERLAKGEIDPEDYEARRRVLLGQTDPSNAAT